MVSESMKLVKAKKFVMVGVWWRVETGNYHVTNNIYEALVSIGFGFGVSKFHICSCVHRIKSLQI